MSSSERALIKLPDDVKEVLIGILLGDGFVVRVVMFTAFCFILSINCNIEENLELTLMSPPLFTPVLIYSDLKSEKSSILRDNKGKSGIYMWTNKVNGKIYIGSSVDLANRLRNYFNISYLSPSPCGDPSGSLKGSLRDQI